MFIVVRQMVSLYFPRLIRTNYEVMLILESFVALICAKFGADLINTSKVAPRKTVAPFLDPACSVVG